MAKSSLAAERLRAVLIYNPGSGAFTAIDGSPVGWIDPDGYLRIAIDGRPYAAHRLAWLYVHGVFPAGILDHADCRRTNNAIANLRLCSKEQNARNRKAKRRNGSGFKGVTLHRQLGKFQAQIKVQGKNIYLGVYDTAEAANAAYALAAEKHFGAFARSA